MSSLLAAFFVETVLISYRQLANKASALQVPQQAPLPIPLPASYSSAIIAFGVLGVLPRSLDPIPGLIGWGLVTATLLNLWNPGIHAANAPAIPLAQKPAVGVGVHSPKTGGNPWAGG